MAVTFSYPAYAAPAATLTLEAQMLGDEDVAPQQMTVLYTRNASPLTRKTNPFSQRKSVWRFTAICNIEAVRTFFKNGEGDYFLYTHHDGSQWVFHLLGSTYHINSINARDRLGNVNHSFDLTVERWAYNGS